jgi:ATP-dependent helicase Lhr and Lhr-like helicase
VTDVLELFGPATRAWFAGAFATPTAAQEGAWRAVAEGRNALVVAPTGSGKTLAAFLWALDRLAAEPKPDDPKQRCRVLYVSPLKALAVDVERNLRAPLAGIGQAARRLELPMPDVAIGIRTGDTPADERRRFQRTPPDVLITTPESLFLILTSQARDALKGVETVIVKEWDLRVVVPVADLGELGGHDTGPDSSPEQRSSIWPHVEERVLDLV